MAATTNYYQWWLKQQIYLLTLPEAQSLKLLLNKKGEFICLPLQKPNLWSLCCVKGKRFYQMLHDLEEWGIPHLTAHLLHKNQTRPSHPQQDQHKKQCPEFLLHFKVLLFGAHMYLLSSHPGSLACSPLLSAFRLPLEACVWSWCSIGHAVTKDASSHDCISKSFTRSVRERKRLSPGGHGSSSY